jgi:hypothetical protein
MYKWDSLRKSKRDIKIFEFWCTNHDNITNEAIGKRFKISRTNINRIVANFKAMCEFTKQEAGGDSDFLTGECVTRAALKYKLPHDVARRALEAFYFPEDSNGTKKT